MNPLLTLFEYSGLTIATWAAYKVWRHHQIEKENRTRQDRQRLECMLSVRLEPGLLPHHLNVP
jgi:hypothetical protein